MKTFPSPAPITVNTKIGFGNLRVTASDRTDTTVTIAPRDPGKAADVKTAAQAEVDFNGKVLRIKSTTGLRRVTVGHGAGAVDVAIEVPTGSSLSAAVGLGDIRCEGELLDATAKSGLGDISIDAVRDAVVTSGRGDIAIDQVARDAVLKTGTGTISLGVVERKLVVKNGIGDVRLGHVRGEAFIKASNGDVAIDQAAGTVTCKASVGNLSVRSAVAGQATLLTATGNVEVGIPDGTAVLLDVSSNYGRVRNELTATDGPQESDRTIEVTAHTSTGDVTIGRPAAA